MKWTMLTGIILVTTGCCQTAEVVQYRQVTVAPRVVRVAPVQTVRVVRAPVVRVVPMVPVVTRVITPVMEPAIVDYVEPLDVTTTTIDFY